MADKCPFYSKTTVSGTLDSERRRKMKQVLLLFANAGGGELLTAKCPVSWDSSCIKCRGGMLTAGIDPHIKTKSATAM